MTRAEARQLFETANRVFGEHGYPALFTTSRMEKVIAVHEERHGPMPEEGEEASPQLRLDGPKARSTDPSTSKEAALRNKPRAGTQRAKLLGAIVAAGPRGMTAEEASRDTGIRLNSASTRMSELIRGGWITESAGGQRRTSGGEKAIVYIAKSGASHG
jgi:hypothetical protein